MKKFLLLLFMSIAMFVNGQELKQAQKIPQTNYNLELPLRLKNHSLALGTFLGAIESKERNFSIPPIKMHQFSTFKKIDMLALAEEKHYTKNKANYSMQLPTRQLQQIKQRVEVYYDSRSNFKRQTEFSVDTDPRKTRDGGIKNEAYEDMSRPFIRNPYGYYYRGNYMGNKNARGRNFNFYLN